MKKTGKYLTDLAQEMTESNKFAATVFDDNACISWSEGIPPSTLTLFDYEDGYPVLYWRDGQKPYDNIEDFTSLERFITLAKTTTDVHMLYLLSSPVWRIMESDTSPSHNQPKRHLRLVK